MSAPRGDDAEWNVLFGDDWTGMDEADLVCSACRDGFHEECHARGCTCDPCPPADEEVDVGGSPGCAGFSRGGATVLGFGECPVCGGLTEVGECQDGCKGGR